MAAVLSQIDVKLKAEIMLRLAMFRREPHSRIDKGDSAISVSMLEDK
jgi:hypothetical protein